MENKENLLAQKVIRKFNKKETLKAHVETVHEVKKPFQCSLCPAKFGSKEKKTKHLALNHAITGFFKETQNENQSENQEIKLIRATETRREYSLPYGWKKVGHKRSEMSKMQGWFFEMFSPNGKKLRSTPELKKYLDENPKVECDLEVTNVSCPSDMKHLKYSKKRENRSEKKLVKKVTKTKHSKDIENSSNQDVSKMREKKKIALKNISCQLKEEEEKEQEEDQSDIEIWEINPFAYQRKVRDWEEHGFLSCFLCDSMLMADL